MKRLFVISDHHRNIIGGGIVLFGLYGVSLYNYLLFHYLAELFSIIVAYGMFMIVWNSRKIMRNNYLLLIGVAYLFVAGLDLLHTLAYKGTNIFPGNSANLPTQLWIAARYLESVSFIIAPAFIKKKIRLQTLFFLYSVVFSLLLGVIFGATFPDCFLEETGLTPFKISSELIICFLLLTSIFFLSQIREHFDKNVLQFIVTSIFLTIASELAFTAYISVYGFSNLVGHFLKIISFYLMYKAVIETGLTKPYSILFRNLKQSEERQAVILRSLPIVLFASDLWKATWVSEEFEHLTGFSAEQFLEEPLFWFSRLHPHDRDRARQLNEVFFKQGAGSVEFRWRCADDNYRWFLAHAALIGNNSDHREIFGIWLDITEHKRVEEEFHKLSRAVEQSPSIVVITDVTGDIEYVNPKFTAITGYRAEEVLGKNPRLLKSGKQHPEFYQKLWKTITSGAEWQSEFCNKKKNGELYWEFASISAIRDPDKKITHWVKVAEDITEYREAQAALQQAKESADAANKAKSEFLAHMSHELRTPLNGILGYIQILKRDQHLRETQKHAIDTIHRSGEHLLRLINDILDLSKIEAGKIELEPTEFLLSASLKMVVEMATIRAEQKNLTFIYNESPELPLLVYGDENRLRQVLLNLLGNAIKYTKTGSVTFQVSKCKISTRQPAIQGNSQEFNSHPTTRIRFQVEDTGVGIPHEKIDKIFHPFQQVGTQRFATEGSGLGLAISYQIVGKMGSRIHVESTEGAGSIFWFDLDLPEVKSGITAEVKSPQTIIGFRGKKNKILIVDDNDDNRIVLREILHQIGFDIREAINGQEALEKVKQFLPDLIIMDLLMPVIDGFETTRRIRTMSELQNISIIAISASAFEYIHQESLQAGCNDFLAKPVRIDTLLEKLRVYLELEWIYEEQHDEQIAPVVFKQETIIPPSRQELQALTEFVRIGDIMAIRDWVKEAEGSESKFSPFITKVDFFAKTLQIEELQQFIGQYMGEEL